MVSAAVETLGQVSTDSWILNQHSEAVLKGLLFELAKTVEHKVFMQSAGAEYQQALYNMLTIELVELP